jgi:hypothetical protein
MLFGIVHVVFCNPLDAMVLAPYGVRDPAVGGLIEGFVMTRSRARSTRKDRNAILPDYSEGEYFDEA